MPRGGRVCRWNGPGQGGLHTALVQRRGGQESLGRKGSGEQSAEFWGDQTCNGRAWRPPGCCSSLARERGQRGSRHLAGSTASQPPCSTWRGPCRCRRWKAGPGPPFVLHFWGVKSQGRHRGAALRPRMLLGCAPAAERAVLTWAQHDARGRAAANRQNAQTGRAGGAAGGRRRRQTDGQAPGAAWCCSVSQVHFFVACIKEVTQTDLGSVAPAVGQGVDVADRLTDAGSGSRRRYGWDAQQKDGQKLGTYPASTGFRQQIQQDRQMADGPNIQPDLGRMERQTDVGLVVGKYRTQFR